MAVAIEAERIIWDEVQNGTRANPTQDTEGMPLGAVISYALILQADGGGTFDGTGRVRVWRYSEGLGWTASPLLAVELAGLVEGETRVALGDYDVTAPFGRIVAGIEGVGVVGGTGTVTVRVEGARRR